MVKRLPEPLLELIRLGWALMHVDKDWERGMKNAHMQEVIITEKLRLLDQLLIFLTQYFGIVHEDPNTREKQPQTKQSASK